MLFQKAPHNWLLLASLSTSVTPCLAHQSLITLLCFHCTLCASCFLCKGCCLLRVLHVLYVLTDYGELLF